MAGGFHLRTLERERIEQLVATLPDVQVERMVDVVNELRDSPTLSRAVIAQLAPEQQRAFPLILARVALDETVHDELSE